MKKSKKKWIHLPPHKKDVTDNKCIIPYLPIAKDLKALQKNLSFTWTDLTAACKANNEDLEIVEAEEQQEKCEEWGLMLRVLCHFAKKNKFIRTPRKSKKTKSLEGSPSNGEEDSQPVEPAEAAALERVRASPKANASPKGKAKAKASPKAKTKKSSPKAKAKAKASTKKKNDESNNLSEEDDSSHASEAESKDDAIPEQHVTPQHKDDIFSMFQSRFSSLSSSSTTKTEKPIPKKAQPIPKKPRHRGAPPL